MTHFEPGDIIEDEHDPIHSYGVVTKITTEQVWANWARTLDNAKNAIFERDYMNTPTDIDNCTLLIPGKVDNWKKRLE